jgi:hypothetical protein
MADEAGVTLIFRIVLSTACWIADQKALPEKWMFSGGNRLPRLAHGRFF